MRCTAYKVAPDDGLIQSETCRAPNEKIKSNHKNFVQLVGLYTYHTSNFIYSRNKNTNLCALQLSVFIKPTFNASLLTDHVTLFN